MTLSDFQDHFTYCKLSKRDLLYNDAAVDCWRQRWQFHRLLL